MSKNLMSLLIGFGIGVAIGYRNEEEIDDMCHKSKRAKKQMMRNLHSVQNYLD